LKPALSLSRLTFEAHVVGVQADEGGLSHVAGEVLSKAFWVGGGESEHLFVHWQRGEDPAEETSGPVSPPPHEEVSVSPPPMKR